jgi:DNA mismatch repair protein MutS2
MLYPSNIEEKLGFEKIRAWLQEACSSELGREKVLEIRFQNDRSELTTLLERTAEMMQAIASSEHLPSLGYIDAAAHLREARVPGIYLEGTALREMSAALHMIQAWSEFLEKRRNLYPRLAALRPAVAPDHRLASDIEWAVDERGEVRDQASPGLKKIRSELISLGVQARKTLEKIMARSRAEGLSPEDGSLTVRSGRLVVPVKAEHKRHVRGFIHDESATGSIAFIEPAEVLDINNEIKDLEYREKREVIAILTKLTDRLRPEIPGLQLHFELLAELDLIRAKARLSMQFDARVPLLDSSRRLDWRGARHPILMQSLESQGKTIVPLTVRLGSDFRILVVSGPNAGGKSVCLKTVGLLQYMLQCGLPIPVAEGSGSGLFDDLFIDIGDEQSIENDLSTYSYHLRNMRHFLSHSGASTLILIDEFGSGTDPLFGGAMAEAILEALLGSGAVGVITTHYSALKKMAESVNGLMNGRMRFDIGSLQPLYHLEIGRPGSSFTLEIAAKIGLPGEVLEVAKNRIGVDQIQLDQLLGQLENEKKSFEELNARLSEKDASLQKTLADYQELKRSLEQQKIRILNEARQEARNLVAEANRRIEQVIREIREHKADQQHTRQQRSSLVEFGQKLKPEPAETELGPPKPEVIPGSIRKGDRVRIAGQESWGEVMELDARSAVVLFGSIVSKIALERLERVRVQEGGGKAGAAPARKTEAFDINRRKAEFSPNLDLRGKRGEDALALLVSFLDDALMFGLSTVRIVHGKGDGILREIVRQRLRESKGVTRFYGEHADRGGEGVTIVEFG